MGLRVPLGLGAGGPPTHPADGLMVARSGWSLLFLAALLAAPVGASAPVHATDDAEQEPETDEPVPGPQAGMIEFADPTGDVWMDPAGQANPMGDYTAPVDLTSVRVHGETGEVFRIALTFRGLTIERQYPTPLGSGIDVSVCFEINGVRYAVQIWYIYDADPIVIGNYKTLGLVDGECTSAGVGFLEKVNDNGIVIDALGGTIEFAVRRDYLGLLTDSDPPNVGSTLTNVWALVRNHRNPSLRLDAAPDDAPSGKTLTFVYPVANVDLRMQPDRIFRGAPPCELNRDLPSFVVEAGGRRTVPVRLANPGDARTVRLEVRTIDGIDWDPGMLPSLDLEAGTPERPHNVTLNVILNQPAAVGHKDCTTIVVRAVDTADPLLVGETGINVVAAVAPEPDRNTFYLHADELAENACSGSHLWMSVVEDEALDVGTPLPLVPCDANTHPGVDVETDQLSLAKVGIGFRQDLNPSRDLVLNTTATGLQGQVTLRFRSDLLPTKARIGAYVLMTGDDVYEVLGEATRDVDLTEAPSELTMDLPIFFTRDLVADGDPSRLVNASHKLQFGVRYEPRPLDGNVPASEVAGRVYLLPDGSRFSLPIFASIKNNVIDPGREGNLLGLKLTSADEVFANPGKARTFNFTLLNEGIATDRAQVGAGFTDPYPWTAEVVPRGPFDLDPGESVRFQVIVRPSENVPESQRVRVHVVALSLTDPAATASSYVTAIATRGENVGEDPIAEVEDDHGDGGSGLPAPAFLPALAAVAAAVHLARRRR